MRLVVEFAIGGSNPLCCPDGKSIDPTYMVPDEGLLMKFKTLSIISQE